MVDRQIGIIGESGFIGREIGRSLRCEDMIVCGPSSSEVDITDIVKVTEFIKNFRGDSIILSAAYTDVEGAEKLENQDKLGKMNIIGVWNVARVARQYKKHVVFISTDFVFEGTLENPGPYNEKSKPADPNSDKIGKYAKSKLWAEKMLEETGVEFAIVRISYPFGSQNAKRDFLDKTLSLINQGYGLYDDLQMTPTYIPDLVHAVAVISERRLSGIFHVATHPSTTPYEFGLYANRRRGHGDVVRSGSFETILADPKNTRRPLLGGLDAQQTEKTLGLNFLSWEDAIKQLM